MGIHIIIIIIRHQNFLEKMTLTLILKNQKLHNNINPKGEITLQVISSIFYIRIYTHTHTHTQSESERGLCMCMCVLRAGEEWSRGS